MDLIKYRDVLIENAEASVMRYESRENRRRGCLNGLRICRSLVNAADFQNEIQNRVDMEDQLATCIKDKTVTVEEYWEFRAGTAQLEFIYARMKPAYGNSEGLSQQVKNDYLRAIGLLGQMM